MARFSFLRRKRGIEDKSEIWDFFQVQLIIRQVRVCHLQLWTRRVWFRIRSPKTLTPEVCEKWLEWDASILCHNVDADENIWPQQCQVTHPKISKLHRFNFENVTKGQCWPTQQNISYFDFFFFSCSIMLSLLSASLILISAFLSQGIGSLHKT